MRQWLIPVVLVAGGMLASSSRAEAQGTGPFARSNTTTAAFPYLNPPGYYTNRYYFEWYFPWYANYNYSHGPYANWYLWGGYATYGGYSTWNAPQAAPVMAAPPSDYVIYGTAGTVSVSLPADARLLFNGTPADGTGTRRVFLTPKLTPGQEYAYDLTAEVTRDGKLRKITERVVVRAGETTNVTLGTDPLVTVGTK